MEDLDIEEIQEHGDLVAGLDIGTTKICAVIGEVFDDRIERRKRLDTAHRQSARPHPTDAIALLIGIDDVPG